MIEGQHGLGVSICEEKRNTPIAGLQFLDLSQEGNLGRMNGRDKVRIPPPDISFSTYARVDSAGDITSAIAIQARTFVSRLHIDRNDNKLIRTSRQDGKLVQERGRDRPSEG